MGTALQDAVTSRLPSTQRRRGGRFPVEAEATLCTDPGAVFDGRPVRIFNVSMTGVGFHHDRPLGVGAVFRIHLDIEYMWLNSRFVVTRCEPREHGYDVGGEFIEEETPAPPHCVPVEHAAAD